MTEQIDYANKKLLEVFITANVLKVKDQEEHSQYTIIWGNRTDAPRQEREHLGPKTDGVSIILMGIQDILEACPQDQPVVITMTHKRVFKAIKDGCGEIEGTEKQTAILKPHITKIRNMILSRKVAVFAKRPNKARKYRILNSRFKNEPLITTYFQPAATIGSSPSSIQLVDDSSVVPPSRTSAFTPVMQQQVGDSSVAPSLRISAFTPVLSGCTLLSSSSSPSSNESRNQLLRPPYEEMPSEHGIDTTSFESQTCTYSSTIIKEQRQKQDTQPMRGSKRLCAQLKKSEEGGKHGLQLQEAAGSSSSAPNETKSKNVETSTQKVQEGTIETLSLPSPLSIVRLLMPSGDGNKHVIITDEQKRELILAGQLEHKKNRALRQALRSQQRSSPKATKKNIKDALLKVQHGGGSSLSFEKIKKILHYKERREKAYEEYVIRRKEYLEVNQWFDSMKLNDRLNVRRTFNAYNKISLEKTLNEEERKGMSEGKPKAMCLNHINQQKQGGDRSSDGIFAGLLKKFGF